MRKAVCIKDYATFKKGKEYKICGVLHGYQITDENEKTIVLFDDDFNKYFSIL